MACSSAKIDLRCFQPVRGPRPDSCKRPFGTILVIKNGTKAIHAFAFESIQEKERHLVTANRYVLSYVKSGYSNTTYQVVLVYGIPIMDFAGVIS